MRGHISFSNCILCESSHALQQHGASLSPGGWLYGSPTKAGKKELEGHMTLPEGGVHRTHHGVTVLTVTYLWPSETPRWAHPGFHTDCCAWNNGERTKAGAGWGQQGTVMPGTRGKHSAAFH